MTLTFTHSSNPLSLINALPPQQEETKLLCKTMKENSR